MRSIRLSAASVLCATSLCAAQATRPARPATQPSTTRPTVATTRPALPLPSADSFLPRLGSDVWQKRQHAEEELVRMGEDARPLIKELLARPLADAETRTRLESALSQINENRAAGPSFITMHLKDANPKTVFAELSRQCYSELKPFPDNLFDQSDLPKVSIDIDRQPFWKAMNIITEKTGIDLQQYNDGVRLMRGAFHVNSPYSIVHGPFMVVATQITRTQTQMLANGGGTSSDFSMQLTAYSEPKIHVLSSSASVKLDEVVDNAGHSLIPDGPDNRGYYGGGGGTWNLFAQLKYPDHPGDKIARFRGNATFLVQTKSQQVQIPDVKSLKDLNHLIGDMPVIFHDLKKNGETWELRLSAHPQAFGGNRWAQFNQSVQSKLRLIDSTGQDLDHRGMRSRGNGTGIEFTILFATSVRPADARHSTDPDKLLWEVSTGSKEVNLPFEFKDLPMPK
jgi:hypothetical protein